ncbi:MAG: SDR family oxidoreductase [Oscillospiraceae bacterium]
MKTVIVTGASRGIGRQIAIDLANSGWQVAAVYNTSVEKMAQLEAHSGNIKGYRCDMSSYSEVEWLYEAVTRDFGQVSAVVNNAGVSYYGLLQDMTQEDIARVINTDLNGVIYSCQQAARLMVKNHSGIIVNISSIWGINGASCEAVYSAAKGGVIAFTKALAQELAPSGIRVNSICPGVIKTDMLGCFNGEDMKNLQQETPLDRLGEVGDISNGVQFFLSEGANFITGQNLTIDGGFSL